MSVFGGVIFLCIKYIFMYFYVYSRDMFLVSSIINISKIIIIPFVNSKLKRNRNFCWPNFKINDYQFALPMKIIHVENNIKYVHIVIYEDILHSRTVSYSYYNTCIQANLC